jgi:hypothetical protein
MADEAAAPRSSSPDQRWQSQASEGVPGPTRRSGRRLLLIGLFGLFLAFLSLAALWVLLIKPPASPPFYLAVSIGTYNDKQYPIIPFTRQDGDRILRHFPAKRYAQTKTPELLRSELKELASRSEPLIVHITALALARDGKVFLLPGDADPADESRWVDVHEIIDALSRCPARHKLLILDLAHPLADARLGVLADRVAETLEDNLSKDRPSFYVLCPCSAGQYALTSEVLQGSVLAHYIDQGLQGSASLNKDPRVTVSELFAFVEARVDRWAQQNRGVRQKPRLLGDGHDFTIVTFGSEPAGPWDKPEPAPYPARLQKGWTERDAWWNKDAFRRAPRLMLKLEAQLVRQEELWRGAAMPDSDVPAADAELQTVLKALPGAMAETPLPPVSLDQALQQGGMQGNAALADAVARILLRSDPAAKKEIADKLAAELLKKLQDEKGITYPQQAWAVVEALSNVVPLKQDQLRLAQGALAALETRPRYVDDLYVRRLADFAERKDPEVWQPETVRTALLTMRARGALAAALAREPAFLPWLASDVEAGDKVRFAGEEKLLWKPPSTWKEAAQELQSARKRYEDGMQTFKTLQRARRDLDRSFAELPAYLPLICDGAELDAPAEQAWFKAIEEATRWQAFFAAPPKLDQAAGKIEMPPFNAAFQDLGQRVLRKRIKTAQAGEDADAVPRLLALLDSPLLSAKERTAIFDKQRALAAKLAEATDGQDQEDNRLLRASPTRDEARRTPDRNVALVRARMSLALLRLAGFEGKLAVPDGDAALAPADLARLERAFQTAWQRDLIEQWRTAKPLARADALDRVLSPWELKMRVGPAEPTRRLHDQARTAFARWLADRCAAEGQAVGARDQPAAAFFSAAARDLRAAVSADD